MHTGANCQRRIWLLSGTGEGPDLAKALIEDGWKVTVSVVSFQASLAYEGISLEDLKIGPIKGTQGILGFIQESQILNKRFDWVIDATHPFAKIISSSLRSACQKINQPLLRYERPLQEHLSGNLINSFSELACFDLSDQKLLMAIGSRHLKEAVSVAQKAGANVFARILPTPESLRNALSSSLPSHHLALIRPSTDRSIGNLELALCRKWNITGVVCRQSGSHVEKMWREISRTSNLNLWIILRPKYSDKVDTINNYHELLLKVSS
tara:strand:+ start:1678 stop:2478 length:801 start_codon:yes stop_codon:yes gene_type:complete